MQYQVPGMKYAFFHTSNVVCGMHHAACSMQHDTLTGSVGVGPIVVGEAQRVHFAVVAFERNLPLAGADVAGAEVLGHREPAKAFFREFLIEVSAERAAD